MNMPSRNRFAVGILLILLALFGGAVTARAEERWPQPVEDSGIFSFFLFDLLEYQASEDANHLRWDVAGWVGGDYNRLWLKSEGRHRTSGADSGKADAQILYGRLISPFWDFQVGVRHERVYGPGPDKSRSFAVIGLQGLAPYWFELEPSLFISEDGDVSARFTAEYDLPLTQRLILQPRFEIDLSLQKVEKFGVGQGVNDVELGLRLRYEIRREIAPYVGVSWRRDVGETAGLARRAGEDVEDFTVVGGMRIWF